MAEQVDTRPTRVDVLTSAFGVYLAGFAFGAALRGFMAIAAARKQAKNAGGPFPPDETASSPTVVEHQVADVDATEPAPDADDGQTDAGDQGAPAGTWPRAVEG